MTFYHTPGHTRNSCSISLNSASDSNNLTILFTGETLLIGYIDKFIYKILKFFTFKKFNLKCTFVSFINIKKTVYTVPDMNFFVNKNLFIR